MSASGKVMRKWLIRYFALAAVAIAVLLLAIWAANGLDGMGLSRDGLVALILTVAFTAVFSVVLMGLVFYSGRSGHDETVADGDGPTGTDRHRHGRNGKKSLPPRA